MERDSLTLVLLVSVMLAAPVVLHKAIKNPRWAVYFLIVTVPFTRSLGEGAIGKRLTVAVIAGVVLVLAWLLRSMFVRQPVQYSIALPYARRLPSTAGLGLENPKGHSKLFPYAWGLGVVAMVSVVWNFPNFDSPARLVELAVLVYLLVIYTVLENVIVSGDDIRKILGVWLGVATVVVGIGLWDGVAHLVGLPQIIGPVTEVVPWRYGSTFRHYGQLAIYLHETFFVALAYASLPGNSRRTKLWLAALELGILALIPFTPRRSTYLAFAVSLAAFSLIARSLGRMLRVGLLLVVGALLAGAILSQSAEFMEYFRGRVEVLQPQQAGEQIFLREQVAGALEAFSENVALGIGLGGFQGSRYDAFGNEVHSTYLQILAETGVVGFVALFLFLMMILKLAHQNFHALKDPDWLLFSQIIFAELFGLFVSAAYNRHLRDHSFWILLAVIATLNRWLKHKCRSTANENAVQPISSVKRIQTSP
jgi:hypothetical protein